MQTDVLISFIIPAYNAADTIEKAVQSLTDVPRTEVLIVENGSTDETKQVLQRLKKKYSNIKIFTSDKGVSNARNLGIQNATGEWLAFVDADDYLARTGVATMMNDARHGEYDFFAYGHVAGQKQNSIADRKSVFDGGKLDEGRVQMIQNPTRYMQVWAKLFRRDIIEKNRIRFDAELPFAEDSKKTLRYMKHITSICWKPEMVYHYTLNPKSVMHVQTGLKAEKYICAMEKTAEAIQDENEIIKKEYDKYNNLMTNLSAYPADRFSAIRASAAPRVCSGDALNGLRKHNRKTALRRTRTTLFLFAADLYRTDLKRMKKSLYGNKTE